MMLTGWELSSRKEPSEKYLNYFARTKQRRGKKSVSRAKAKAGRKANIKRRLK